MSHQCKKEIYTLKVFITLINNNYSSTEIKRYGSELPHVVEAKVTILRLVW